ncbi:MAG: adenylate/guanylate cyclase domain-containing protein [Betaproteobacteria bacterium]
MHLPLPRILTDASLYSICLAVLVAALADLAWLHWTAPADANLSDAMIRWRATARTPDPDIVVVDIDERSLAALAGELGRFPWPRSVYGELIAELRRQGAQAVVMDIELYEPDRIRPENDDVLNESLVGSDNTFFPLRLLDRVTRDEGVRIADVASDLALVAGPGADPDARLPMQLPFVLDRSAWKRTGIINFLGDRDGIGRQYWLYRDAGGWRIPSLPMRVAAALRHPVPDGESFRLSWFAGQYPHARVAFSDIYADLQLSVRKRPAAEFAGKIVVIGASATHLGDIRATPVSGLTPGVEILATAIDNLKRGERLVEAPSATPYLVVLLLFLPLLVSLKLRWGLVPIVGWLLGATALLIGGAYAALSRNLLLPMAAPLVFAWLFFFLAALRAYLKELRAKEQREMVLSRFLDRRLVKELVAEGVKLEDIKSETRAITVLFSDIRGFTAFSETRPAEEVVKMLNRYLELQTETVFRHGGTLDKFIGDAIMAFWGAPTDDPQHALHAVECALDMAATLERYNAEIAETGTKLDIGIGLHSGPAVVGFIGSQRKLEYTAIGDTVNLASRIEGETKGRTRVLVTSVTRDACGSAFAFRDFGTVTVKGRQAAVQVFSPTPAPATAAAAAAAD